MQLMNEIPLTLPTNFLQTSLKTCPFCEHKLKVSYLTTPRLVKTLNGPIQVCQTVMVCPNLTCQDQNNGSPRRIQAEEYLTLSLPNCQFGMDVTLFIGYHMHLHHQSLNEVWNSLTNMNLEIDLSTVYRQYQKYLAFMKNLTEKESIQLNEVFQERGGYVLSLDAVQTKNSPPLLVCRELTTETTLMTGLLHSENEPEITEILQKIREKFGQPIAVVSDMSLGISKAIEKVFPSAQHQYCHFHFLKNLGKALLEEDYKLIREQKGEYKKKSPHKSILVRNS